MLILFDVPMARRSHFCAYLCFLYGFSFSFMDWFVCGLGVWVTLVVFLTPSGGRVPLSGITCRSVKERGVNIHFGGHTGRGA